MTVPISISYHGGGIKVFEYPGIIGLGWTLMASANISRTVYGYPDEMSLLDGKLMGYFGLDNDNKYLREYVMNKPGGYTYLNADNKYCIEISKYCRDYEEGKADVANDVLTIAGMGLEGVFSYASGNINPILQTSSDITVSGTAISSYPLEYKINDKYGTEYTFGELEYTTFEYQYYYDRGKTDVPKQKRRYISAWHLSKMKSLQGDEMTFEYKLIGKRRYMTSSYQSYDKNIDNPAFTEYLAGFTSNSTYIEYEPKLLWRIKTDSEIVEFEYDSIPLQNSTSYYDRLKRILIRRNDVNSTVVKTFEFQQSDDKSFGNIKGKQLETVYECSPVDSRANIRLYSFEYNDSQLSDGNLYLAQDHWGYYNGKDNPTLIPKQTQPWNEGYRPGNRDVNISTTQYGILKKIIYPTGGYTNFEWEQHDYSYINNRKTPVETHTEERVSEYQLCGISKYEKLAVTVSLSANQKMDIDISHYVEPLKSTGLLGGGSNTWTDYTEYHSDAYADYLDYPHVAITNLSTNKIVQRIYIDEDNSQKGWIGLSLPNGNYKFELKNHLNMHNGLIGFFTNEETRSYGYVTIRKKETVTLSTPASKYWGGVRIASITSHTGDDTYGRLTKTYSYVNDYRNPTESSGVVPFEPEYEFEYCIGGRLTESAGEGYGIVYGITSNGLPSTVCGQVNIEYYRVFETIGDSESQQIVEYNYKTHREEPDALKMKFSGCSPAGSKIYTSNAYKRGNLLSKKFTNILNSEYYVYDICGHLCYVVSPEAADRLTAKGKCDTVIVNKLCTYFRYDERGNMVERRLPGIAPEYFVYDKLDRLIFCQDGHLRKNEYWRFYAYDGKLRPALEGIAWLRGSTRESLQKAFKNKTVTAHMDSLVGYDMSMGYRLDSSFYTQKFTQAWYYDNYDYWTKFRSIPSHPDFPQDLAPSRMGKLTGQAVMAGGGTPIYTLRLYNKDDFEVITCEDKMNGEFCRTVFRRVNNFGQTVKELEIFDFIKGENQEFEGHTELSTQFSYMKPGGKISHLYSKIDNSSIFSCSYGYNDIGKLLYKHGAKDDPHFSYDVSGNIISMQGDIYSETLSYTPGGMIADKLAEYKVDGKTVSLGIEYTYDRLGRLTDAVAYESPCMSIPDEYTEGFSYDKNGNITSIARGLYGGRTQDCAIDYNGNQISRITDTSEGILASDAPRFESGSYENPFAYDNYGRITKDEIRGVTKILYNELSQPVVVTFKDGCEIRSIYSDDGTKRRTTETTRYITTIPVVNKGDTTYRDVMKTKSHTITEYFGRLQRRNGEISRVDVGEGFFTKDPETGQWSSHSYIKDRLGSVVAVTGNNSAVEQYTLYFASGLPVVYDSDVTRPVNSRLHTGKEYLSFEGLHWYDNHARMYDPLLMRFTTPDPLAEQFPSVSPYAYCNNNPVNFIDPDGKKVRIMNNQNVLLTGITYTITPNEAKYLQLEDDGYINKLLLNEGLKDIENPSSNYKSLVTLVNDVETVEFYTGQKYFTTSGEYPLNARYEDDASIAYKNSGFKDMSFEEYVKQTGLNTHKAWVGTLGATIYSDEGAEGVSLNGNHQIYISSNLIAPNGKPLLDMVKTIAHEAYGHMFLKLLGFPHSHTQPNVDRTIKKAEDDAEVNYYKHNP